MYKFTPKNYTGFFNNIDDSYQFLKTNNIAVDEILSDSEKKNILKPNLNDLARLLKICQDSNPENIIEYGCGFSSLIFHNFLNQNYKNELRSHFQIIEVHRKYLDLAIKRFDKSRNKFKLISDICSVQKDNVRDDGSHKYLASYKFNPDLIYLDGPDPKDIEDSQFIVTEQRVPISSDLLSIESWLLPATIIVVDGRSANVRYLKRNLQRNWEWDTNYENDCSIGILNEEPLGKKSIENLKNRGLI